MSDPYEVARAAADAWGLPAPTHLRTGMSSLFSCGEKVVLRVARNGYGASAEHTFLEAMASAGVRTPRLVRDVVDVGDGVLVSAIERVEPEGDIDWRAVGEMVRLVHSLDAAVTSPLPWCLDFPHWDIEAGLADIASAIDHDALAGLRSAVDRWPDWRNALAAASRVLSHGDVHPGNVVPTAAGPVLLDWDLRCMAPAGWDHAALLTWSTRWNGTAGMYEAFADGYGVSLRGEPAAECLAELRLVVATIMRVKAGRTNPEAAVEAERRLRYWRGDVEAPRWTPA